MAPAAAGAVVGAPDELDEVDLLEPQAARAKARAPAATTARGRVTERWWDNSSSLWVDCWGPGFPPWTGGARWALVQARAARLRTTVETVTAATSAAPKKTSLIQPV